MSEYKEIQLRIENTKLLVSSIMEDTDSCSVPDPDLKLFGLKDPDPDPPLFTPNLKICFKNVLESEQIHHDFIHNTCKV